MNIEQLDPNTLVRYANNSRTHTEDQIKQVMASIQEFGFTNPILLHEGNIVLAGHCRLEAAERLGLKTVPCIKLGHLSKAQARAYVIADNKLALNANWNEEKLKSEIDSLLLSEFDISLLGFNADELKAIGLTKFSPNLPDEDDEPNLDKPLTLTVHFEDEDSQEELFIELRDRGYKVK